MANYGEMTVQNSKMVLELVHTERVVFAQDAVNGGNLAEGVIVAKAAGTGKLKAWASADGAPFGVLLEGADATAGDVTLSVLTAGVVDKAKLVSLLGEEAAPIETAVAGLRMNNIIAKEVK